MIVYQIAHSFVSALVFYSHSQTFDVKPRIRISFDDRTKTVDMERAVARIETAYDTRRRSDRTNYTHVDPD